MKKLTCYLSLIVFLFAVQSCIDSKKAKNYNDKTTIDQGGLDFIKNGIEGGLTEIKASTVAETNSTNPRVVNFAKMMLADHTTTGNDLKKIEREKLVDTDDSITQEHQAMISALSQKSGVDFDKAYMQMMVNDHEQTIQLFINGEEVTNQRVQEFAKKNLPAIRMHLDSAKAIYASLK